MTYSNPSGPGPEPWADPLGQLIQEGREAAEYLWRAPEDVATRQKVGGLLAQIHAEATAQGKHEMPAICETLSPAANWAPTPYAVELLQDGFERLHTLWLATQSRPA